MYFKVSQSDNVARLFSKYLFNFRKTVFYINYDVHVLLGIHQNKVIIRRISNYLIYTFVHLDVLLVQESLQIAGC